MDYKGLNLYYKSYFQQTNITVYLPEYNRYPIDPDTICPVKSTSIQELIAVILGCWDIICVLLV